VSSVTGTGIDELKQYLLQLPDERKAFNDDTGLFRLPIDRVFSSHGHGTVVTGTVLGGQLNVGDELELLPQLKPVKVRGIQSHNRTVNGLSAGHRGAINIQGIEQHHVKRGDVLAALGIFKPSQLLTCRVNLLATAKPLKYNCVVRIHIGTGEYLAQIRLIGPDKLKPGETVIAQLVFEQPLSAGFRDRFIIRQYSPMITIGGGVVLDAIARPLRKKDRALTEAMDYLISCNGTELIGRHLERHALTLYSEQDLVIQFSMPIDRIHYNLIELAATGSVVHMDKYWVSRNRHEQLKTTILTILKGYHSQHSLSSGMARSELLESLKIPQELMTYLLKQLFDDQRIKVNGEKVAQFEFQIELSDKQQGFIDILERDLKQAGFNPPDLQDIHQRSLLSEKDVQLIIAFLLDEKRIVQIDRDKFIHGEIIAQGGRQIRDYLKNQPSATVSELKDVLNTSRKWAIPILNYYDKIGLTTRVDDQRELKIDG